MNGSTKMFKLNIIICFLAIVIGYYSYVSLFRTEPLYKDVSWIHQDRSVSDYMYYGYYNLKYYYCYKIMSNDILDNDNLNSICGTSTDYLSSSYFRYQYHNSKDRIKSFYSNLF